MNGTASSSKPGWEKERVDRGSEEKPEGGAEDEDRSREFDLVGLTRHIPRMCSPGSMLEKNQTKNSLRTNSMIELPPRPNKT